MLVTVKAINDGDDSWIMTIELLTNKLKVAYTIEEPYLNTYEKWMELSTSEGNVESSSLRLEDGYYTLYIESGGNGNGIVNDFKVSAHYLAGPLLQDIEDAKKRGLEFRITKND